jgi:hypothetical protein
MSTTPNKLTKKQRKSLAHRERHKKRVPATDDALDIPELDLQDDDGLPIEKEEPIPQEPEVKNLKRKRHEVEATPPTKQEAEEPIKPKKQKISKPERSTSKGRYILFIGTSSS